MHYFSHSQRLHKLKDFSSYTDMTHYRLDGQRVKPLWVQDFPHPTTNWPTHTIGAGSLPGVKQLGCSVNHPLPFSTKVKERADLYVYPLWAFMACYWANFTFIFSYKDQKFPTLPILPNSIICWVQIKSIHC